MDSWVTRMWPLVRILVTLCGLPMLYGLSCPDGVWGPSCEVPCNCLGGCSVVTGTCDNSCLQGWREGFGRPCNKRNLAFKRTSTVTSVPLVSSWPVEEVVDGDRYSTCMKTPSGLTYVDWTVDMKSAEPINSILVVLPEADQQRHSAFNVSVLLANGTWQSCHQQETAAAPRELTFSCPVIATQVRIASGQHDDANSSMSSDIHLDLCEVEVYECAPGLYGSGCGQVCSGNCRDTHMCDQVTGACPDACAPGWQNPASGCRTACTPGTHGADCSQTCGHCKDDKPCDTITGGCVSGCQEGYTGVSCQQTELIDKGDDEGISTPGVVGAVAGGTTVFLCCVCVIAQIRRRLKKDRVKRTDEEASVSRQETAAMAGPDAAKNGDGRKSSIFRDRKISIFGDRKSSVFGGERRKSIFAAVFGFAKDEDLSSVPVYTNNRRLADSLYDKPTDGVPVDSFRQFVYGKRRGASSLENEFKALPTGFTASYEEAEKVENKDKNRFSGYYPYDFNRVILKQTGFGDYINGSIIKDYKGTDAYIAAQGPDKKTVLSFWHMVWQENVDAIVMLTKFVENKKAKCDRYWSENACVTYGDITVKDSMQMVRATYTIRVLKVMHKKTSEARDVHHFHYTEWPEQATPLVHDLLEFIWRVKASQVCSKGPLLVHCSDGVGRTGTYIAIDSLLQEAEDTGYVDVRTYVERLRQQRKNMVLTKEQYAFVHAALIDGIILGDTRMSAADFSDGFQREGDQLRIGYRKICEQFHELSYLKSAMSFRRDSGIETVTDLRNVTCDGIFMQFVPSTLSCSMLRLVDVDADTDVQKFLLLLRNINALTVVCLHEEDLQIFKRCLEWSKNKIAERERKQKTRERKRNPCNDSDESEDEDDDYYLMEELSTGDLTPVVASSEYRVFVDNYEEMNFVLLSLSGWQQGERLFSSALTPSVISMADTIFSRQEELGFHPVVLLCGEVQESAGLFCVLCNIVHGIQLEREVEVYSNVCRVRRLMPEIVTSMEEFLFCHQFAAKYVESHQVHFTF